jgi:DNA-binding LacI/PurR family transcriptional regulator
MSKTDPRRPAMVDVAELAGLSHQTVSRVLNNKPGVRPETRKRVLAAIEQLDYRRNIVARALVTNRTQMLGVVAFGTTLFGPASTLHGIQQAAREAKYFVTMVSLDEISHETVSQALDVLSEYSPDGIVVIAPQRSAFQALAAMPIGVPLVAVEGGEETLNIPVVCVDQEQGARLATEHLLGLGHKTVHHLAGPAEWLEAEGRIAGWRACLENAGAAVPAMVRGDWTPRSGYEAGVELLKQPDVTAVFAANDQMALGLLMACREAGVRVPDDISVVGFDCIPESEFFAPPLTTIVQDFQAVGRSCIRALLGMIERGEAPVSRSMIPTTLVVRGSATFPPPAAADLAPA